MTETELAVLKSLWREAPATIRRLRDELYPGGGHSHYATVQSLLDRLEEKGFVERSKEGRVNVFRPTLTRAELIRWRLRQTADSLCGGSMAPLLSHLVEKGDLSAEELAALDRLIDRLSDDASDGNRG